MTNKNTTINLTISKSGKPCLWERGGAYTNTGDCQIICGPKGEKLRALYIKQRGTLACEEHALIPIKVGYYVIQADIHRSDEHCIVYRIESITENMAELTAIAEYSQGEWELPSFMKLAFLAPAINVAEEKVKEYHCRRAMFVSNDCNESSSKTYAETLADYIPELSDDKVAREKFIELVENA